MKTLVVKTPPMRGPAVKTLQTALRKAGYYTGPIDGIYSTGSGLAAYHAKIALGFARPDHEAGDILLAYLEGKRKPTAAMRKRAAAAKKKLPAAGATSRPHVPPGPSKASRESEIRTAALRAMHFLLAHEAAVHYPAGDIRTRSIFSIASMAELEREVARGLTLDCSQSGELVAHVCGAADPSNFGYRRDGYTGSILDAAKARGWIIPRSKIQVADFVIFGPGTGHHMAQILETGSDPLLFSHGQEKGPIAIRLSVEAAYQPAGIRFVRLV